MYIFIIASVVQNGYYEIVRTNCAHEEDFCLTSTLLKSLVQSN